MKHRNVEDKGYKLEVGDIIKLGRIKFKIKEVKLNGKLQIDEDNNDINITKELKADICEYISYDENTKEFVTDYTCRVCLSETYTKQNPLINICQCSGSVK